MMWWYFERGAILNFYKTSFKKPWKEYMQEYQIWGKQLNKFIMEKW